jgi:hypothetical protein
LSQIIWNAFAFMEFQEGGGRLELALLLVPALGLDFAELVHSILELAGEPLVVQAESGQLRNQGLGTGVSRKQRGFKEWNASESPGGVGEFLGELGFGGSGGLVFVEELAAVKLIGSGVLSSEDGGAAGCRLLVAGCWLLVTNWGGDWVCHQKTSSPVVAWADGDLACHIAEVIGPQAKIDLKVA